VARRLRRDATPAEQFLWSALRGRRLAGARFRRQLPIDAFFVDFCCLEHRLVVEVDGSFHQQPDFLAADSERTAVLARYGFRVLRFTNYDVLHDRAAVLAAIETAIRQK
jgi:very-short-patch-repair endonuclease